MRKNKKLLVYITEHKLATILVTLSVLLTYYYRFITTSVSMDSTIAVMDTDYVYQWQSIIGRDGLLLINQLFGIRHIIPGYCNVLMIVATIAYGIVWMSLIGELCDNNNLLPYECIFPVLYLSSIPMIEVVSYQHQGFQIALGTMLIGIALYLWWVYVEDNRIWKLIVAMLCAGLAFSTYQSLITFMISAIIGTHIIYCEKQNKTFIEAIVIAMKSIVLVALSYIVFKAINLIGAWIVKPTESTSYLTGQILWGKADAISVVYGVIDHIKEVVLGYGLYSKWYLIGILISSVVKLIKTIIDKKPKQVYLLADLALLIMSPFFINIVSGSGRVAIRAELSYACTYAMLTTIAYNDLTKILPVICNNKLMLEVCYPVFGTITALLILATSITPANRLLYTDYRVLQEQYLMTVGMHEKYEQIDAGRGLIPVFVGQWHPHYDDSMVRGELLGNSLYEWGNRASTEYWQALGYEVVRATPEQLSRAYEIAEDMPRYPLEGSVAEHEGMIIFALPDPIEPQ